jgi:hypothetical protein
LDYVGHGIATERRVRGDTVFSTKPGRLIAIALFHTYRFQINSARRVSALGLPHVARPAVLYLMRCSRT